MANKMNKSGIGKGSFFESDMLMSKAFLYLNGSAKDVLLRFLFKRKFSRLKDRKGSKGKYVCENGDSLTMTYKELEAEPYGWSRPRISRAIDDLLEKGFIEIKHKGGCYQKDKSIFGLVDDWRLWIPGRVTRRRKPDVKRGYQGRRIGATAKNSKVVPLPTASPNNFMINPLANGDAIAY